MEGIIWNLEGLQSGKWRYMGSHFLLLVYQFLQVYDR